MKFSDPAAFLRWPHKAVTLLGMSGVGKTTLANCLPRDRWFHYSGDYRIGTRYLDEPILDNIKRHAMKDPFLAGLLRSDSIYIRSNITVDNLAPLATFLGKLGDPARGGLDLAEFKRRQRLHHLAEIAAMLDVESFIHKAQDIYGYQHFLNDAGGSLCELDSPEVVEALSRTTLILYIRANDDLEEELKQRARRHPKPLYYQEAFLDRELAHYLHVRSLSSVAEIDPDDFVSWVFPRLIEHRRPRYQALADGYGYTVDYRQIASVRDAQDFESLIVDCVAGSLACDAS